MPYKSPLAKLPTKRARMKPPKLVPPEHIRLPDGTQVETSTIMDKAANKINYNLRAGMQYGYRHRAKIAKIIDDKDKL